MSKFQEYLPIYEGDRFCLMCGQACPVRRVTRNETTSPHGWALLISSVQRGMLQWNAETVDVLYKCSDCGNCQGNCATDRPLPYAIQAARAEVVRLGHMPASVKTLDEKLRARGTPFGEQTPDERREAPSGNPSSVLFVGDAAHHLRPPVVDAAEKLLRATGVNAARFRAGQSGGYLPYTVGLWDTARAMARDVVSALQENNVTRVIVLSPVDAHTLKHVYAELGVALPEHVNITTLVDHLAAASAGERLKMNPRNSAAYTYHDSAQSVRLKGYSLNARVLASEAMGSAPREMTRRESISPAIGTSGGHLFTQPALAELLARQRLADAAETGAEIILTDEPLDTVQLEKYAAGVQVLNLFEVMAEQLA